MNEAPVTAPRRKSPKSNLPLCVSKGYARTMNPDLKSATSKKRVSKRGNAAPTIADVAKQAGCSPMTVSRVINGEGNVREETRANVLAAIKQLNMLRTERREASREDHSFALRLCLTTPLPLTSASFSWVRCKRRAGLMRTLKFRRA